MPQLFRRGNQWLTLEQLMSLENNAKEENEVIEELGVVPELVIVVNPIEKKAFTCDNCGKVCKSEWHLNKHFNSHTNIVANKNN